MTDFEIRAAVAEDLPAIVAMLADDPLGAARETPHDLAPYRRAFDALDTDPRQHLLVAARAGRVIGVAQLTVIPGLSRTAMTRGQIEGVRAHADARGAGVGAALIEHAVDLARGAGCGLAQLTTDISRADAHRFYERLGFVKSHYGYKL
ncbi:MAG TPA: GNAT family N-acetyltransferase, partial [Stackebrandtia sp.]|uniref:GNAT family N-acetyltransferase n=1 Tax=Stackebrandtia sp. TaxID=2023065 RepID=UPI002D552671